MDMTVADFERLVQEAIEAVPAPFDAHLARVPVLVVEHGREPGLLGRYTGVPLPHRAGGDPMMPSVIEIFMRPLMARARSVDDLREQVRVTVLHELGHHLGMDEHDLDRLGYA